MVSRIRIGELLVDAGLLTRTQLDQALKEQSHQGAGGKRLGQLIVSMQLVNEVQLARVLSQQLAVPWVSLAHIDFSKALLTMVPQEMAEMYCVIPVYVRRERRDVDTLYLAMDDPTHDEALRAVSEAVSMPVRPMIAPPSDIRLAIARNYGSGREPEREPASEMFPLPLVKKPATVRDASMFTSLEPTTVGPEPIVSSRPTVVGHRAPDIVESVYVQAPSVSFDALGAKKTPQPPPVPGSRPKVSEGPMLTPAYPVDRVLLDSARPTIAPGEPDREPDREPPRAALEPKVPQLITVESLKSANAENTTPAEPAESIAAKIQPKTKRVASTDEPSRPLAMIALTLLDGTRVALPPNRARTGHLHRARDHAGATDAVRDTRAMIDALKAQSAHLSPEERERKTESILAALLTVLLRKSLVTDEELLAALQTASKP